MSKKQWIIGVDNETNRYTPTYVDIRQYKIETGFKEVKSFTTYQDCLSACQKLNEKKGLY